jgi:hypothetical protein
MLNEKNIKSQIDEMNSFLDDVKTELSETFNVDIETLEGYQITDLGETGLVTSRDGTSYIFILPVEGDAILSTLSEEEVKELR